MVTEVLTVPETLQNIITWSANKYISLCFMCLPDDDTHWRHIVKLVQLILGAWASIKHWSLIKYTTGRLCSDEFFFTSSFAFERFSPLLAWPYLCPYPGVSMVAVCIGKFFFVSLFYCSHIYFNFKLANTKQLTYSVRLNSNSLTVTVCLLCVSYYSVSYCNYCYCLYCCCYWTVLLVLLLLFCLSWW